MQHEQIFQVEDYFEKAFASIIETAGIKNVFRSREKRDAQTPYVEVKFLTGTITEKHTIIIPPQNTQWIYAAWTGSRLELTVTTHRQNNGEQHKTMLGKLRYECQMYRLVTTWPVTEAAPVHAIADIREEGTVHLFDSENDLDSTTLTFVLLHNIRDEAFTV